MPKKYQSIDTTQKYAFYLSVLLLFFCFRVFAQLIQKYFPTSLLPSFSAWYSGALAYSWLLLAQGIIILLFSWVIDGFLSNKTKPRYRLGCFLLAIGSLYFCLMTSRLIAGLTFAKNHPWWGATIPAFFHLVLAAFLLIWGHYHWKHGRTETR